MNASAGDGSRTMLHLILGAPKSGKSEYAERLIAGYEGATVYVGTLPRNPYYSAIILEHRERRPPTWGLIELIGDPHSDLGLVSSRIGCYRNVLVDGLLFYLLRLAVTFKGELNEVAQRLLQLLVRPAGRGEVLVVDPLARRSPTMSQHRTLCDFQAQLIERADTVAFVENKEVRMLDSRQLSGLKLAGEG